MGRKRRGDPVSGWILLDKPLLMTSAKAVSRIKRLFNAAKAGHSGTLDPLATGVLPIALGEATKTVSYVMDGTKGYRFTVRWGEARSTDDEEGEIVGESPVRPEKEQILQALKEFIGEIEQVPPVFSAIKVDGARAYDLARRQQEVTLSPRKVHVEKFDLLEIPDCDHATFSVICGKGTYIRSLARDLAKALGTLGYVACLRRTQVGAFTEKDVISLDSLEALGHSAALMDRLLPVETVLDDIPALALADEQAVLLRSGQAVSLLNVSLVGAAGEDTALSPDFLEEVKKGQNTARAMCHGRLLALVRIEKGRIHPFRVFNLN